MHPEPPASLDAAHRPDSAKGCLSWGCGGCLGVAVLGSLLSWIAFQGTRQDLTASPFPPASLPAPEGAALEAKVGTLQRAAVTETTFPSAQGIRLSDTEVNALLSRHPALADSLRVAFHSGVVVLDLRLPYNPPDRLRLRAELRPHRGPGGLELDLRRLRIGGFNVPSFFRKELKVNELLEELTRNEELRDILGNLDFEIQEGRIEFRTAPPP